MHKFTIWDKNFYYYYRWWCTRPSWHSASGSTSLKAASRWESWIWGWELFDKRLSKNCLTLYYQRIVWQNIIKGEGFRAVMRYIQLGKSSWCWHRWHFFVKCWVKSIELAQVLDSLVCQPPLPRRYAVALFKYVSAFTLTAHLIFKAKNGCYNLGMPQKTNFEIFFEHCSKGVVCVCVRGEGVGQT